MRFLSVNATAFGMLSDASLELAPGLTVIYGENEAGKSTWHDAIYAGLCGMRRSRGAPRREDKDLLDRRTPWDAVSLNVGVEVELANGHRMQIAHDLPGNVDCRATDMALGRDVSSDIMSDGSPDGARWLGLDRRSFPALACVRQSDILAVRESAESLQEHIQRAAATAGRDETAAAAIDRIVEFKRANVGLDRTNSTRPLRAAIENEQQAESALRTARSAHDEYLELGAEGDAAVAEADRIELQLRHCRAVMAERNAAESRARLQRATALAEQFPNGAPTPLPEDDAVSRQAARALKAWEDRPTEPTLVGPTSDELQKRLDELPAASDGDLEPHEDVEAADRLLEEARRAVDWHGEQRPASTDEADIGGVDESAVRGMLATLETEVPPEDAELSQRTDRLHDALAEGRRRTRLKRLVLGAGLAALLVGALVAILRSDLAAVGATLVVVGIAGVVTSFVLPGSHSAHRSRDELSAAETELSVRSRTRRTLTEQQERARARAGELGLPADAAGLRAVLDRLRQSAQTRQDLAAWTERLRTLEQAVTAAATQLAGALGERGVPEPASDGALESYRAECAERARRASAASSRSGLESQIRTRRSLEQSADETRRRRDESQTLLHAAGQACGLPDGDEAGNERESGELARNLAAWQKKRSSTLEAHERARTEYATLEALLDGRTIEDLARDTRARSDEASALRAGLEEPARVPVDADPAGQIDGLEDRRRAAIATAEQARGRLLERARAMPSVPEAEERLATATAELERVRRLDRILATTLDFLTSAQDTVHRDIAPLLADSIRTWLPRVTGERYVDVRVDPASLHVTVKSGESNQWRAAHRLSHGTAEQIFLLLRLALTTHLTAPGEVCPLILDEVTTNCDDTRCVRLLDLLAEIAAERQIVLFSCESRVEHWARANLVGARDALVEL